MQTASERVPRLAALRNRPLMTLTFGHFTVDMYAGLLPVLYPLLIHRFELDLATVGMVALAYTGMASLVQPFFGWVADRYGTRFIGLALVWSALMFATIGFAPNFTVLLLMAAAAGIGSGAYHPFGALNASAVIAPAQRNSAMSFYVTGGTLGVASGPLIGSLLFTLFGVEGTALVLLPGLSIAIWMLFEMRTIPSAQARPRRQAGSALPAIAWLPLAIVIGVMMARAWTLFSIQAFIPTWYEELGYGPAFYGPLATTLILASAVGTIGVGSLADRFGRKQLIIWSLVLTIPALLLLTEFTGPPAFPIVAFLGLTAATTGPLMLVMAQQLMVGRAGMASGLILGLGFITGAIGVPITGALADAYGIETAIRLQVLLVFATIGLAMLLPGEARMRELAEAAGD